MGFQTGGFLVFMSRTAASKKNVMKRKAALERGDFFQLLGAVPLDAYRGLIHLYIHLTYIYISISIQVSISSFKSSPTRHDAYLVNKSQTSMGPKSPGFSVHHLV